MRKLLCIIYVCANIADFGFTVYGVLATSLKAEVNPIARGILVNNGIRGLSIYKFGGVLFVLVILALLTRIGRVCSWVRYTVPILLLLGIAVGMLGAWSWLPIVM